jgi:SsrA-binding protein
MAGTKGKETTEGAVLARNRAASHEFHLLDRFEAGIVLTGTEVKSIRAGRANVKDGYAKVTNGEVFLHNATSPPTSRGTGRRRSLRTRKLLLNAREIRKIGRKPTPTGVTLVPLRLYLKNGRIKVELAIAKGKKAFDKREAIAKKDVEREMARARGARRVDYYAWAEDLVPAAASRLHYELLDLGVVPAASAWNRIAVFAPGIFGI